VAALGRSVFTTYLFPFEITAALLVIAVVGAVVLARRLKPETDDGSDRLEEADRTGGPGGSGGPDGPGGDGGRGGDEVGIDSTEEMARAVAETVSSARERSEADGEEVRP
jgi:hypothetical protein